jgi:hypothetical protein
LGEEFVKRGKISFKKTIYEPSGARTQHHLIKSLLASLLSVFYVQLVLISLMDKRLFNRNIVISFNQCGIVREQSVNIFPNVSRTCAISVEFQYLRFSGKLLVRAF